MRLFVLSFLTLFLPILGFSQTTEVYDDFEGNTNITTWAGDDCGIDISFDNPYVQGINTSQKVLKYQDTGGTYANVRFDVSDNFNLSTNQTFALKIYIPSSGITGNQTNQVSLKLQDGTSATPWTTQSEIIKTAQLDQWQTLTFNFKDDNYINLDVSSLSPIQRTDFNRVVIQVNGEGNTDQVLAYIDDIQLYETVEDTPVFDHLVWSDEFDTNGAVDDDKWFHQTQIPYGDSWFNGEVQHYTNRLDNSYVEDGMLKIVAKRENFTDQGVTKEFTSARLNSKFAFTYGKVEVRAKLPTGAGTWPAIWMLGQNINENGAYWQTQGYGTTSWPQCGEIDIMEHWGDNQNYVQSATHTPSSYGATINHGGQTISTASTDFHIYTLVWTAEKLVFSVDGVVHYTYNPSTKNADTWPFDAPQYMIFNIALTSNTVSSFNESEMEIDYIRIYQESNLATTEIAINESTSSLYPNPVDDELNIKITPHLNDMAVVKMYNTVGTLVKTEKVKLTNGEIKIQHLNHLPKGIYFVRTEINGKIWNHKFIKN